jgi:hypothetical protein
MKAIIIVGIGCLSIIVFAFVLIVVGIQLIGPFGEKIAESTAKMNREMAAYFDSTVKRGSGEFSALPLDSSIHDSTRLAEWQPRFQKYSKRFGRIASIDSCWLAGNMNTSYDGFDKDDETVWGQFKCRFTSDSGSVEFEIDGRKYSGVWAISRMQVDEKFILTD